MAKTITLKDVAKHAGVSTATVARVLHNNGYVAAETRERVELAVAETSYQLNIVAQGLRKQRSLTIGHLLHTMVQNPFFTQVALGVEEEALKHGYNILVYNVQGSIIRERLGVETFIRRRADAIIFTTAHSGENIELALQSGIPVVQVERLTSVRTSAVLIDNYTGAQEAMQHLLKLGHRRIGYIGSIGRVPEPYVYLSPKRRTVEEERLAAYRDAMMQQNLEIDERLIRLGEYLSLGVGGFNGEGYKQMKEILQYCPCLTAVFATSDMLAAGALQAIYEAGLHVPNDISVVGFDDTYARYLTPPLTTVALPTHAVGRAAARLALEHIKFDEAFSSTFETLPSTLQVRQSTGLVPKSF